MATKSSKGRLGKQISSTDLKDYGSPADSQMSADIGGLGNLSSPNARKKGATNNTKAGKKGR